MDESNMGQNQQNTVKSTEEIDIFEVGSRVWNGITKLFIGLKDLIAYIIILLKDICVSIIILLIRKWLWIAIFTICGMLIGLGLYEAIRPSYLFTCEGETGGIDNTVVIEHVNRLNLLLGDTLLLANYLNLTVEQALEIRSIKACYGIDITGDGKPEYIDISGKRFNHKDSTQTRLPSFVHFRISLYDKEILPAVREGFLHYIKNNVYIQDLYRIDKEQRIQMIEGLDKEIARLDKIDSVQRSRMSNNDELGTDKGQIVFLNNKEQEIRLLYTDILALFTQRQVLQRHIDLIHEPVLIVQDFIPVNQKERPLTWFLIRFGGMMAFLGIFCAMIWQYRKTIWKTIREDYGKKEFGTHKRIKEV